MRLNRTLLFTGVFIAAIGLALIAVQLSPVDGSALVQVLRAWPLAVIAIGAAIVLRRTQLSLASGLVAAAIPGLLLGTAMASSPRYVVERGIWDEFRSVYTHPGLPHVAPDIDFDDVPLDRIGGLR